MTTASGGALVGSSPQPRGGSRAEQRLTSPSGGMQQDMRDQPGQAEGLAGTPVDHLESSPLRAYLATALTGLANGERNHVFEISDLVAAVCSDFGISLYEPRKATDPVHHPEVPDQEVFRLDRRQVTQSDLLIYLADYPSTGAGQELIFAHEAIIPIIVMASAKTQVSRMVTGIPGSTFQIRYEGLEDLRAQLIGQLKPLLPILIQRRTRFRRYQQNRLGERIRQIRTSKGLTYNDLAQMMGTRSFSAGQIEQWEQSSDLESNLSLIYLREVADALGVALKTLLV